MQITRRVLRERLERSQIRGCLDGNGVTGIEEHLTQQIEALLGAIGDQHLARANARVGRGDASSDPLAQRCETISRTVLQSCGAVAPEDLVERTRKFLAWKRLGRRHPARKRYQVRMYGQALGKRTDRRIAVCTAARGQPPHI